MKVKTVIMPAPFMAGIGFFIQNEKTDTRILQACGGGKSGGRGADDEGVGSRHTTNYAYKIIVNR